MKNKIYEYVHTHTVNLLRSIVQENAYRLRAPQELRAMTEKDWRASSYEDWAARFCERKYNSGFSREMSRSVGKYLEEYSS